MYPKAINSKVPIHPFTDVSAEANPIAGSFKKLPAIGGFFGVSEYRVCPDCRQLMVDFFCPL